MRGSLITSRTSLAEQTGLSVREVRTCLKRLKETNEVTITTTKQYTIITINSYDSYQSEEIPQDQEKDPKIDPQATHERPTEDPVPTHKRPTKDPQATTTKESNNIKKDNKDKNERKGEKGGDPSPQKDFCKFFNDEMEREGAIIPRITMLAGARRTHFEARAREHGREAINEMVRKAARSDFLNGRNGRGWKATFDWLILPANFIKVIEGAYDNIPTTNANNNYFYHETLQKHRHDRRRGVDLTDVRREDYTDKI